MKKIKRREDFQDAIQPYLNSNISKTIVKELYASAFNRVEETIRVKINGQEFLLPRATCIRIPKLQAMLTRRKHTAERRAHLKPVDSVNVTELCFERNATVFAAIVDYAQNSELHMPQEVCPQLFAMELDFWGFDINEVEPCCYPGVVHFLWEQEKLTKFHGFLHNKSQTDLFCSGNVGDYDIANLRGIQRVRAMVWRILEEPFSSRLALAYFYLLCIFILMSFFIIAAETVQEYKNNHDETLYILEHMCAGGLYLDYLLRIVACPHLRRFFLDPINLTDGIAVLSSVTKTLADGALASGNGSAWFTAMNVLQLLRILRLLRPMSKVTGFRLIYFTLRCSFRELLLVFMLLMFLMIVFSSLLYYLGEKKDITSIPHGMWFSLITMTTVGYGDIVPKTVTTRLIGSVVAVCGVIMMSMTTPIMVSNFHSLYINSVVGEPSSIKRIKKESGLSPESSVSAGSTSFSGAQSYIAPWKRQSFRITSVDGEENCSPQQGEPQKARVCRVPACCRLPGKRRLACVHPKKNATSVSKDSLTREFRAKTTATEHISPTVALTSVREDKADGYEADRDTEEEDAGDESHQHRSSAIRARNERLIRPHYRTWYAAYDNTDTDGDTESDHPGNTGATDSSVSQAANYPQHDASRPTSDSVTNTETHAAAAEDGRDPSTVAAPAETSHIRRK